MVRALIVALLLLIAPASGLAGPVSDADRSEFVAVITGQIEAFRADDEARAYSYAAPTIRRIFPDAGIFMQMVRRGYKPVYRPQSFKFGAVGNDPLGRPAQRVTVVGPDGKTYEAVYSMERQPDGTWKIVGCTLAEVPGASA